MDANIPVSHKGVTFTLGLRACDCGECEGEVWFAGLVLYIEGDNVVVPVESVIASKEDVESINQVGKAIANFMRGNSDVH